MANLKRKAPDATGLDLVVGRFGEALAHSRRSKSPVSFRVDISPDGRAKVTALDLAQPQAADALSAARERGRARAAEIVAGPDMLSADDFAGVLGVTRATVNAWRQTGQVLGLEGVKRGFRFPDWQIDADGKPFPELPVLHELLSGAWSVYRFLVASHPELGGRTGKHAMQRGQGRKLIDLAEAISRGDFS